MLDALSRPRPAAVRYGVAVLAVAAAFVIQALLDPFVQGESPFLLLSVAVLIGAVFGGLGPALMATLLGALVGDYFFLPPVGTLVPPSAGHGLRTVLFLVQGLAISAIGAGLASARRRAESSARRAEEDRGLLRESEERYRAVVEQAGEGIFLFEADAKRILETNSAFQQMLGYSSEELLRMKIYDLIAEDPDSVDRNIRETLRLGDYFIGERRYRRRDGSIAEVEVSGNVVTFAGRRLVCALARDITERRRAEEALREVREAERSRIARDLHDDILQDLVYALQEIQLFELMKERSPSSLGEVAEALRRSVEGLRESIFELRLSEISEARVTETMRLLVDLHRRMARGAYEIEVSVAEEVPEQLPAHTMRELAQIFKEALNNVRRHAYPGRVLIGLAIEGERLVAEVCDDGRGFDPSQVERGIGSYSMRQRAAGIGGELSVESTPGEGTRVRLSAPLIALTENRAG